MNFLPIWVASGLVCWAIARSQLTDAQQSIERQEVQAVERARSVITRETSSVVVDLLTAANQPAMHGRVGDAAWRAEAEVSVMATMALRPNFSQVRILDLEGHEQVRIDRDRGREPRVVPVAELQDKSDRYYVAESADLQPGELYVSLLDLNVEYGEIVRPYQPTMRYVTPITNLAGQRTGLLVVNHDATLLLAALEASARTPGAVTMLANGEGYWLQSDRPEECFSFMFPEGPQYQIASRFPGIGQQSRQQQSGQMMLDGAMFTWAAFRPITGGGAASNQPHAAGDWTLVSMVPPAVLAESLSPIYLAYAVIFVLITALWGVATCAITHLRQRNVDAALRARLLGTALDHTPSGVLLVDRSLTIAWANPTTSSITGLAQPELVGKGIDCLRPDDPAALRGQIERSIATGSSWSGELVVGATENGGVPCQCIVGNIPQSDSETPYALLLLVDMSERRRYEQELIAASHQAEAANRAKSTFLSRMSHEIRTPLNAVLGFAQILTADPNLSPGQRDFVDQINRGGRHLLDVLRDVLEVSRIEAGHVEILPKPCDLDRVADDLLGLFRLQASSRLLGYTVNIADDVPRHIIIDAGKLRQITINLIGNAIKYTDTGSVQVVFSRETAGEEEFTLRVEVRDTGRGIAAENHERMFQSFEQVDNDRVTEGTGLGLAICRHYVALLGGEIGLESELGSGSTFWFILPTTVVPAEAPTDSVVEHVSPAGGDHHLLVVDDQPANVLLMSHILDNLGLAYVTATNGQECLDRVAERKPDLILMDLVMPVMDGFQAIRHLRSMPVSADVPIIAVTASHIMRDPQEPETIGANEVIQKPFDISHLSQRIAHYLKLPEVSAASATIAPVPAIAGFDPLYPGASALPAESISEIRNACLSLDIHALNELILELEKVAPEMAEGIKTHASAYDFEAILRYFDTENSHHERNRARQ